MSKRIRTWLERRRADRHHIIQAGRITYGGHSLDCIVLNVSAAGAKVHLPSAVELPERVVLTLPDGTTHTARFCWRKDEQAGFEFLD